MDIASGADRHLDITFSDCWWLIAHLSFPYFLEKRLAIPKSPFFSLINAGLQD